MPFSAVELRGLTKQYEKYTAVNNLNPTVHAGSIYGLLGPNGAGKSTTIHMMLSLISQPPAVFIRWVYRYLQIKGR